MESADQLMAAVREQKSAAFEELYDRYSRLVYAVGLRMLGDVTAAEDVTQAVFLTIWSRPQLFKGGNFTGWLARVARNRCLDTLRTRHPIDVIAERQSDESLTEETAFAEIDAANIRDAIARLPGDQRQAIELGFYGGISQLEISRRTGAPLGTVKSRIRAGLHRLRVELNGMVSE